MPSTNPKFARFEPTALPKAKSVLPCKAPVILMTSSGALVPNATTVSPMIILGTLRDSAMPDAPLTKLAPPNSNKVMPNNTKRKEANW